MSFQALSKSGEYLEEGEKISTTRGKTEWKRVESLQGNWT